MWDVFVVWHMLNAHVSTGNLCLPKTKEHALEDIHGPCQKLLYGTILWLIQSRMTGNLQCYP